MACRTCQRLSSSINIFVMLALGLDAALNQQLPCQWVPCLCQDCSAALGCLMTRGHSSSERDAQAATLRVEYLFGQRAKHTSVMLRWRSELPLMGQLGRPHISVLEEPMGCHLLCWCWEACCTSSAVHCRCWRGCRLAAVHKGRSWRCCGLLVSGNKDNKNEMYEGHKCKQSCTTMCVELGYLWIVSSGSLSTSKNSLWARMSPLGTTLSLHC